MQLKRFGVVALFLACWTLPAWAHHSHASYESAEFTVLEGTLKTIHFLNPHSWLYLEIKDANGVAAQWALEGDDPATLFKSGVKKDDVRAGDPVRVRCYRARDGARTCLLKYLTPLHGDAARGHGVEQDWD